MACILADRLRSPGPEHSRALFVLQILLHHRQRAEILVAYGPHDQRVQKRQHPRQSRCRGAIDPCGCAVRFQPIANVNAQVAQQQPRLLVKCEGVWWAIFRHAPVQRRLFPVDIAGTEGDGRIGHLRRRAIEARRWQPPMIVRQVSDQRKDRPIGASVERTIWRIQARPPAMCWPWALSVARVLATRSDNFVLAPTSCVPMSDAACMVEPSSPHSPRARQRVAVCLPSCSYFTIGHVPI